MNNIYLSLHYILVATYIIAPILVTWRAIRRGRDPGSPRLATLGTFAAGTAMGVSLSVVYAVAVKGRISIPQVVLASYFATALMIVLKAFDALLRAAVWRISVRKRIDPVTAQPVVVVRPVMAVAGNVLRVVVLFGFGLPYVMAAVATYRPKVLPNDDPMSQLGFAFERVSFEATDGVQVSGWWLPSQLGPRRITTNRTVILCHGLGANKSNQLVMCRQLIPVGYNVLAIDLRAHGESGGQISSFGSLERRDVLGAVRWIMQNRAAAGQRIYGVGASQGAAALIAAAADPSPEGQAIAAVAAYGTYDDLGSLVDSICRKTFLPPLSWVVDWFALPVAGAHAGDDLASFRPAELAERMWPRPILVIHGVQDQIIDFSHGKRLFERATQPKEHYWIDRGDHNSIIASEDAAEAVRLFFDSAEPRPVI